jgi:hypothetical protein
MSKASTTLHEKTPGNLFHLTAVEAVWEWAVAEAWADAAAEVWAAVAVEAWVAAAVEVWAAVAVEAWAAVAGAVVETSDKWKDLI